MTMFEHLPRFLRGSSADEIGTEPLDARIDEANNRLADVMLLGIAVAAALGVFFLS